MVWAEILWKLTKEGKVMEQKEIFKAVEGPKQQQPNLTGIPTQMKLDFERRSGLSFDDVRVHYNSDRPAKIGALAYTQGTQVHIGPGQNQHLGHELGHVVQQKLGMVRPDTRHASGVEMNTDQAMERQADLIGKGAVFSGSGETLTSKEAPVQLYGRPVVQAVRHVGEITQERKTILTRPVGSSSSTEMNLFPSDQEEGGQSTQTSDFSLVESKLPTMVFESMGTTKEACFAVYKQTLNYPGNTICVFGLNQKVDSVSIAQRNAALETIVQSVRNNFNNIAAQTDETSYYHMLCPFPFVWEKPANVNAEDQYKMPFVEARVLVMQKATEITDIIQSQAEEGNRGGKIKNKFLYRWIDGDAEGDTSKDIPKEELLYMMNKNEPVVRTGSYDWRSLVREDTSRGYKTYCEFIGEINRTEKNLREYYYYLWDDRGYKQNLINKILAIQHSSELYNGKPDKREEIDTISKKIFENVHNEPLGVTERNRPDVGNYLPGYYLPETVLLMNETAHLQMVSHVETKEDRQDKESMRLVSELGGKIEDIIHYLPELTVTKPLKNEFVSGSYLSGIYDFLKDYPLPVGRSRGTEAEKSPLTVALKNLRQSAFDPARWYFVNNAIWNKWEDEMEAKSPGEKRQKFFNKRRRELRDELLDYLMKKETVNSKEMTKLEIIAQFVQERH